MENKHFYHVFKCDFFRVRYSTNVFLFSLLLFFRENHETEKSALNNIADNTVAMEVT